MKKILIPVALLMMATVACKKKTDTGAPVVANNFKTYASIDEVFTLLSLQPKVMIYDAGVDTSFYGNSGTRYAFRKNSFQYPNGDTVTGNIQIAVTEYMKKGDMIFSGVLPVSDGKALVSGGEINMVASKNGQEIFLRPGYMFQANIPQFGSKDTVMSVFKGNTNGGTSTNKVNWQLTKGDTAIAKIVYKGDTTSLFGDSLNLWNSDHFYSTVNLQNFKVNTVATGVDISSASGLCAYALFDTQNGLMSLYAASSGNYTVDYLPKLAMHFISFGLINGHFYAGVTQAAPATTGSTYTITLTEVDPADFKAQVNGLY